MGISSALYSAISGLQSNSQAMTVIGNNISNSNTIGFKSSSTIFSDILSANIASSSGDSQVGRGSQVQTVQGNFSQGGFQSTSNSTDIAIEGSGFFIVRDPSNTADAYTRNGSFSFDKSGYLVNADGYRVQGSTYNANGSLVSGNLSDIQVDKVSQIPAKQTTKVTLETNLDSNSTIQSAFDLTDPTGTSNYSTSTTIYDSLGTAHLVTCYFSKTAENAWDWNLTADSADLGGTGSLTNIGSGAITFDAKGNLVSGGTATTSALTWSNGADPSQVVTYNFDPTQFNSDSTVFSQNQDGYASGQVTDVNVATDGTVSAVYSNGQTIPRGKIALATFSNSDGLTSTGGSLFTSTANSGTPTIGYPGSSQGTLVTKSLELSNVDLATEMVNLITIQNGYSANSKVITTTDQMLEELLNLKR